MFPQFLRGQIKLSGEKISLSSENETVSLADNTSGAGSFKGNQHVVPATVAVTSFATDTAAPTGPGRGGRKRMRKLFPQKVALFCATATVAVVPFFTDPRLLGLGIGGGFQAKIEQAADGFEATGDIRLNPAPFINSGNHARR